MKYRDIEYPVIQGIERGVWKWWTLVDDIMIRGQAAIKSTRWPQPTRALTAKKVRLVPPEGND
jgi:hypothetical protein